MSTSRRAIIATEGEFTYDQLDDASRRVAAALLDGRDDLEQARVAFLVPPSFAHAAVQRGIWRAGGVAVPLAMSHPPAELEYVIRDSGAAIVVADPACAGALIPVAQAAGARLVLTTEALAAAPASVLPHLASTRRAMIVYTSGTTGRPKGVVTTHQNIGAQVASLVEAWGWKPSDHLLLVLPLHHVHGIVNGLASALAVRATCEMLPSFDAARVWDRLSSGDITVFTAVPTIYSRLVASWDAAPPELQRQRSEGIRGLRLMMSGSAALPVHVLERWRDITGHTLLERYGMTEIGMALSNPLDGERRPGTVGVPLPTVDVHLVDEDGIEVPEGQPGEVEVEGPTVFREYWQRPEETQRGVPQRLVPHRRHGRGGAGLLPAARPHQRGHHQDRRVQGVGARNRRGAPHARRHRRVRRRGRGRRGVGRARLGGSGAEVGRDAGPRANCRRGRRRCSRRTRCRARYRWCRPCPEMRWERWSSPRLPGCSNRATLLV